MIARLLPYPALTLSLIIMWMGLNGFTPGHLILGTLVALGASMAMASLRPSRPKRVRWLLLPKLIGIVLYDIVRSNLAVGAIILGSRHHKPHSAFLTVPLDLEDQTALAVLAVILTSTPGSAWLEYNSTQKTLLVHVLDLTDERAWIDLIKNRYEKLLQEIFE